MLLFEFRWSFCVPLFDAHVVAGQLCVLRPLSWCSQKMFSRARATPHHQLARMEARSWRAFDTFSTFGSVSLLKGVNEPHGVSELFGSYYGGSAGVQKCCDGCLGSSFLWDSMNRPQTTVLLCSFGWVGTWSL